MSRIKTAITAIVLGAAIAVVPVAASHDSNTASAATRCDNGQYTACVGTGDYAGTAWIACEVKPGLWRNIPTDDYDQVCIAS